MAAEPLDVLKALHEVNFNRWEKRRSYEWLLSYAIWGALAAFIAVVIFGKDSQFRPPEAWWKTAVWLFLIFVVHGCYLFFIIDGTLRDLEAQRVIELAMCNLVDPEENSADPRFREGFLSTQSFQGFTRWHSKKTEWLRDRHGLWGQLALTVLLCAAAGRASITKPKQDSIAPPATGSGGYLCQGCSFGQPQSSLPKDAPSPNPGNRAEKSTKHK